LPKIDRPPRKAAANNAKYIHGQSRFIALPNA
jgi:hypothetical protein